MQYLMAIDAGTGSVRAVIFDTKGIKYQSIVKNGHTIKKMELKTL